MFPILFELGPLTLYSLWIAVCVGMLLGTMLFLKNAKYERLDLLFLVNNLFSIFLGGLLMSRFIFFLFNWGYFGPFSLKTMLIQGLSFWQPGYSFWGGVLGGLAMFLYQARKAKEPIFPWLHATLIPFFVGIMIGNIGQLLDGQGYGRETVLPWGITFQTTNVKYTVPVHPTQIYSILLIAALVLARKKIQKKWAIFQDNQNMDLLLLSAFALGRFILECFRGDDTLSWGIVRMGHIVSLAAFVLFASLLYKRLRVAI